MSKIIWSGCPNNLPITIDYIPENSSENNFYLAGSAFTKTPEPSGIIGFKASVNGTEIVSTEIYSNSAGEHRATVPGMKAFTIPLELEMHEVDGESIPVFDDLGNLHAKTVTITIDKVSGRTKTDINDRLVFAIM